MADSPISDRWDLVRRADIPRNLRHLLLILQHYQRDNNTAWCSRAALADELGVVEDVVSQSLKALEELQVVKRVWTGRFGRPTREFAIQFSELRKRQRTLRESSDCTLSESSECKTHSLSESSDSLLANPQTKSEGILRGKQSLKNHRRNNTGASLPKVSSAKFSDADMTTAKWMFDIVLKLQPEHKKPNFSEWAKDIRLMRERDSRTDADIRELFAAADGDEFWQKNIRSPAKLRQKWDRLDLEFRKSKAVLSSADDWSEVWQIVRTKYHPDLKNASDVQKALSPEQFNAAKAVGLARIANVDKFDKETPEAYRAARKNTE